MNIALEYVAMLKVSGPPSGSSMELSDRTTASGLLDLLGLKPEHQRVVVVFVNEIKVRPEYMLKPGDRVYLAMPVGGG
jgi:sulfur carrier protein ThiS